MDKNNDIVRSLPGSQSRLIKRTTYIIERTHLIVLIAVFAVLSVATTLFILGAIESFVKIWEALRHVRQDPALTINIVVAFVEIISDILKAVIFYLVGISFYSLFVMPLDLCITLGIRTLHDLESQLVTVIIVILGVEFLEHFILWQDPDRIIKCGISAEIVIFALALFHFLVLRH